MRDKDKKINMQPNWKNKPSIEMLLKDYSESDASHSIVRQRIKRYEQNISGGAEKKVQRGKSTYKSRLVKVQGEWKYPSLEDPFLSSQSMFDVAPRNGDDKDSALQNKILLNYQWNTRVPKTKLIGDIVRTLVDEGTVIVKTGWEVEEKVETFVDEEKVMGTPEQSMAMIQKAVELGKMTKEKAQAMIETGEPMPIGTKKVTKTKNVFIKNNPTYEVCDNMNVRIDPTAQGSIENANFIIHDYEVDISTLKKNRVRVDEDGTKHGIYYNLENIDLQSDQNFTDFSNSSFVDGSIGSNLFSFQDKARKKLLAHEYWGFLDIRGNGITESVVVTWIGQTIIRMEENPFPHKKLPFDIAAYMPVKKSLYGQADSEITVEDQNIVRQMTRAAIDITATHAIGQELADEKLFPSETEWLNWRSGRFAKVSHGMNPKASIYKQQVNPVDPSVFQMINSHKQNAEEVSSVRPFSGGNASQSLGVSATAVRSANDATSKRELGILRRIKELISGMGKKTIMMNQMYISPEETIRTTDREFVTIKREDIAGEYDLILDVSTPEKDEEKARELAMMVQTIGPNGDPKMTYGIMADIARLRKMPKTADKLDAWEPPAPQPDPAAEELKKIQLENAKLQNQILMKNLEEADSKIMERYSRAKENEESDGPLKLAKAKAMMAQAERMMAEAEQMNIENQRVKSGKKREEHIEDKEFQAMSSQEREEFRAMSRKDELKEQTNEGVKDGTIV